jgi:hypothetical protein
MAISVVSWRGRLRVAVGVGVSRHAALTGMLLGPAGQSARRRLARALDTKNSSVGSAVIGACLGVHPGQQYGVGDPVQGKVGLVVHSTGGIGRRCPEQAKADVLRG